jgi:hypothetical protein
LGADHHSTLASKHNLAATYSRQGKYDRAETLFREVADSWKQKEGADSTGYANNLQLLGFILLFQKKFS